MKFFDTLNRIDRSLKRLADACEPHDIFLGIKTISCSVNPTIDQIGVAFEIDGLGWKKLHSSKEFRAFLAKLKKCQTECNKRRQQARQC